jgi:3-deoxy-7-phosphoheptulonate synthase
MFIVVRKEHSDKDIVEILDRLSKMGFTGHVSKGVEHTVIGIVGKTYPELKDTVETWPLVGEVVPISKPYKLASREFKPVDTTVKIKNAVVGGKTLAIIAGPCAVESEEQMMSIAPAVKAAGANILRGGAFKPSTSPYSFRGMGEEGLKLLAKAGKATGMPVITEVMSPGDVEMVAQHADILQVGARNMQNFILLDEVGQAKKPVMLKRGLSATIQEWLLAAEYILAQGNRQLILCERGIRTFETYTRNTMDVSAIPIVHKETHLPIIADPSHGTGKWDLVMPMAMAAVAAGADGLMIEVHPTPDTALKDGAQSLTFDHFQDLMKRVAPVARAVGRTMAGSKQKNA